MTLEPVSIQPEQAKKAKALEDTGEVGVESDSHRTGRLEALHPSGRVSRGTLRWVLPLVALALGAGIYWLFVATRHMPDTREPVVPAPLVRVLTVESQDLRFSVSSQGLVAPRTESDLVAEVRGRVLSISPSLVVGGFFDEGEELLRLDAREHRIARDRAVATVSLRESEARLAAADADRRRQLKSRGASSTADLEEFESRELVAGAALAEARAALSQAELDLERTIVRAPFAGRVRDRHVDVGQFVSPGTKLGRIFAVDYAEIRLPIQIDELAYLDAGFVGFDPEVPVDAATAGSPVHLSGRLGGREVSWDARLVRTEAAIDEQTRMLHVVARVDDPYRLQEATTAESTESASALPLPVGLFVSAEIEGRSTSDVFVVPVMALRDGDRVFVRDAEDRLRVRPVSVVRRDRSQVVIDGGLASGDQVVVSPLRIYTDGMLLRAVQADAS